MLKKPRHIRADRPHSIEHNFAFAQTYSRNITIRFMGIWDTVSSIGWIYKPVRLLDMAQNPIIQVGRHAVSIDERRAYYRDNLWGPPVDITHPEWARELREQGIQQDVVQVWFPGAHSDVGGSYPQAEAAPANEALAWMISELQRHGAELCQERIDMVLGKPSGVYSADKIFTPPPKQDHCIHESLQGPWWLLQLFPQQHYHKEDRKIQWRVPYGAPRSIPEGAIIHESAVRRMRKTVEGEQPYRPRNLKLDRLQPLQLPLPGTTANLTGCFVYAPNGAESAVSDKTGARVAKVALGWMSFAFFCLILAAVAWCALSLISFLLLLGLALVAHTPGFSDLFRRAISLLRS